MDSNNEKSKIVFENEGYGEPHQSYQSSTPKMIRWVIKYSRGYIEDEGQASYILIGFAVVAIVISFFLFFDLFAKSPKAVQYRENIPAEIRAKLPPEVLETIPSKFK